MIAQRMRSAAAPLFCALASIACFVGCGGEHRESGKRTVVIGAVMPLSGEMAKYGKTSLASLQIAIEDANATTEKYEYKFIAEDDRLTPAIGVAAARKLIDVNDARFLVGAWPSSVTAALIPVVEAADVVLISPASSAPGLVSKEGLFFRTCNSDEVEGEAAAKYATNTLGAKRMAVLYIRNDFGQGLLRVFEEHVEAAGAAVVLAEGFDLGAADFRVPLAKISSVRPDAVYVVGYKEMVALFRQAREMDLEFAWIGTTMLNDQAMVDQMEGAADGIVFATWDFSPDLADDRFQQFRLRLQERAKGLDVDVFAANAYDAALALTRAVEKVGPAVDSVAAYLRSGVVIPGIWGPIAFSSDGNVERRVTYKRVMKGKIVPVVDGTSE